VDRSSAEGTFVSRGAQGVERGEVWGGSDPTLPGRGLQGRRLGPSPIFFFII